MPTSAKSRNQESSRKTNKYGTAQTENQTENQSPNTDESSSALFGRKILDQIIDLMQKLSTVIWRNYTGRVKKQDIAIQCNDIDEVTSN